MNSEAAGTEADPPRLRWRKSTYSNNGGNCVEVASNRPGIIGVRDSKTPTGPVVTVTPEPWSAFLHYIKQADVI